MKKLQMINPNFFYLFLKYLWSTYHVADTMTSTMDTALKKAENT